MNGRTVLISYVIVAISSAYLSIIDIGYFSSGYSGFLFNLLPVAGLILGPYFAIAGLTSKGGSVWPEVDRMLHRHISIPLLGGILILYGSIVGNYSRSGGFLFIILPPYLMVVILGTLISVMASRANKTAVVAPVVSAGVST